MTPEFLRQFAQRMRALTARARTEAAREQLRVWAEEFEAHAAVLETEGPPIARPGDSAKPQS